MAVNEIIVVNTQNNLTVVEETVSQVIVETVETKLVSVLAGERGVIGQSNTLTIGTVVGSAPGSSPVVSLTGASPNQTLNFTLPTGNTGPANSLAIGTITPLLPSAVPTATITGTAPSQTLNLGIPAAAEWLQGTIVPAAGTGTQGDWYINTSTSDLYEKTSSTVWTLRVNIKGLTGPANTLVIGTVSTIAVGGSATSSVTGTAPNQTLNIGIPTGATGAAPNMAIGTVATGAAGSSAIATITGSNPNYSLNLTLPTGNTVQWYSGVTPPATGTGVVNDWYVVNSGVTGLGDVYKKTGAAVWTLQGNIRGAAGTGSVSGTGTFATGNISSFADTSGTLIQDSGISSSDLMRLSTNQTVAGIKTFTGILNSSAGINTTTGGFTSTLDGAALSFARASANYIQATAVGGYIRIHATTTTAGDTIVAQFNAGSTAFTGTFSTTGTITAGQGVAFSGFPGVNNSIGPSAGSLYIEGTTGGNIYLRPNGTGSNTGLVTISTTTLTASAFSGVGTALTALNGTNITTGTVADARLSTNVALLAAANQTFTGNLTVSGNQTVNGWQLNSGTSAITGTATVQKVNNLVRWEQAVSSGVGDLVIYTNIPSLNNTMTRLHIHGYNYSGLNEDINLKVSFYGYNSAGTAQYVNYAATNNGTFPVSAVRLMRHTVNNTVVVVITSGMPSAVWQYPKIWVDGIFGHASITTAATQGWTASLQTDLTAYTTMVSCGITNTVNSTQDQTINGSKTFGNASYFNSTINANSVGGSIRLRATGSSALDGFAGADANGIIYFSNWDASRGMKINADGSINFLNVAPIITTGSIQANNFSTQVSTDNVSAATPISGATGNVPNYGVGTFNLNDGNGTNGPNTSLAGYFGISFLTGSAERMRIDTLGAVSIKGGTLNLANTASNLINFGQAGVAAPTASGARSAGTKIVLFGNIANDGVNDYSMGVEASTLWYRTPGSASFKWYNVATNIGTLSPSGNLSVTGTITASGATFTGPLTVNPGITGTPWGLTVTGGNADEGASIRLGHGASYPNYLGTLFGTGTYSGSGYLMRDNGTQITSLGGPFRVQTGGPSVVKNIAYTSKSDANKEFVFTADADIWSTPPGSTFTVSAVTYTVRSAASDRIRVVESITAAPATGTLTGVLYAPIRMTVDTSGNTVFTGTLASGGTGFSGPGVNITTLNGANVTTGTVADARLSTNVALLTGIQTFSGVKTFSNTIAGPHNIFFDNPDITATGYTTQTALRLSVGGTAVGSLKTTNTLLTGLTAKALYLTTDGAFPVAFGTDNSANPRMVIMPTTGRVGIATSTPTEMLDVVGNIKASGVLTAAGGGIDLTNGTSNNILFSPFGIAAPTFTTRSAGTKIVLYPGVGASAVDYAIGMDGSTMWQSVPISGNFFRWYAATTNITTLSGTGNFSTAGTIASSGGTFAPWSELGNTANGSATTPFIDFHSGATFVDYDSRIIASGGNGTIKGGTLTLAATTVAVDGALTANATTNSLNTQRIIFTVAGQARPTGTAYVEWVGPVAPTNAIDGDTWVSTV